MSVNLPRRFHWVTTIHRSLVLAVISSIFLAEYISLVSIHSLTSLVLIDYVSPSQGRYSFSFFLQKYPLLFNAFVYYIRALFDLQSYRLILSTALLPRLPLNKRAMWCLAPWSCGAHYPVFFYLFPTPKFILQVVAATHVRIKRTELLKVQLHELSGFPEVLLFQQQP